MTLIAGISKKVIFFFLVFFNFIEPLKSLGLNKFNESETNKLTELNSSNINTTSDLSNSLPDRFIEKILVDKKLTNQPAPVLADITDKRKEIIIQSDKQSEKNDVIFADGNVSVSYKGKHLKADHLIYYKLNKKIIAKGNIDLILGDQILKASRLEYSFTSKKGYLLDVQGSINTKKLMDDLSSKFSLLDTNKIQSLLQLNKKKVLNTPGKVENWLFSTDKISIDGNKWKSNKAIFSNDLLELKQVKIVINLLEVIPEEKQLIFNSSLNYLIFEEKLSIPFWLGKRTLKNNQEFFDFENRWNIGYDNLDKDGYFIGRKFNPINISDTFVLDLEPQYLIQRSFKGYTKSFVKKDSSATSQKVKRNANFGDYFALESRLKGRINNWDLEIEKNLNSLDFDKFADALRLKANLSREINFLDSKWEKSFYGIYRERVWNGSLGESEIYSGYGSKLKKANTWVVNGITKTEILSLGLANVTAEALSSKDLLTNLKGNLFYSLDQKFPISIEDPQSKAIDISYKYIPAPITKGLSLDTRLEASYFFYGNGDHQEHLGFGMGPELILGNFKNKAFDYTRIRIFPFYKVKNGASVFKFDQNNERFTVNIALDQQLFGPIFLKSNGTLNLTSGSEDYGEFINSKITLNWKKRSYQLGIFYQPHNQAGGISFNLFGFK